MLGAMEQHRGVAIGVHHGNWLSFRKGAVMERLTIKTKDGYERQSIRTKNQQLIDKLAEYEDLEKQSRLIKLPCKV